MSAFFTFWFGLVRTGGGFFAELQIGGTKGSAQKGLHLGKSVWISVDGLEYGLGMILHVSREGDALLEGYAVGPEDTSAIDFTRVDFAVVTEPGPYSTNG